MGILARFSGKYLFLWASNFKEKTRLFYISHSKYYHPHCLNCHYPLAEFDKFCPNCGQKPVAPKSTMHDLWHEFIHTFFHLDGKFFSTLTHLFLPGKLTEEYFKGHHKRYAHPIQLFLVLGGVFLLVTLSITNKAERGFEKSIETKQNARKMRRIFIKMDSMAQKMPAYQTDSAVKKAIDSLLEKQFVTDEKLGKETDLSNEYTEIKAELLKQRLKITLFQQKNPIDSTNDEGKKLATLLTKYKQYYARLEADSALVIVNYGEFKKEKPEQAAERLEAFAVGKEMGRKFNSTQKDAEIRLKKLEEEVAEEVEKDTEDAKDKSNALDNFVRGVRESNDSSKTRERHKVIEAASDAGKRLRKADSMTVMFTDIHIAQNDIMDLELEDIIEKYKIEGAWHRHLTKRSVLLRQDGASKLHTFFSKFLWILIFSLLPMAGFMYLMYWRQKRYFSEHLVWLLHFNSLLFILSPLLWITDFFQNAAVTYATLLPFMGGVLIVPFFAIKRYYKQRWGKTIAKTVLFELAYFIIALIAFAIGAVVSFLFL